MECKYWYKMFQRREKNNPVQFRLDVGLAADSSLEDIVKVFIESGADVEGCDAEGGTLLHFACGWRWLEVVKTLVRKGWDIEAKDKMGRTPVIVAAYWETDPCIVEHLMDCGADLDVCDEYGQTLMYWACVKGWLEVVKTIVSRGGDLNPKNRWGRTPIMEAASRSHLSIVEYLIERGSDVDICDEDGQTLLHLACVEGWLEVVKSLTKKSSNVNAQDVEGDTPLHLAVDEGNLEIIKHLLNMGADCNIVNIRGKTAFSMVIQKSLCLEVISLFICKGAYFRFADYHKITNNSVLDEGILQNTQLCTAVIINFYNAHLLKLYKIPAISGILPSLEQLQVSNDIANNCSAVVEDISENVNLEIQTKGFCDVLNARPIFLRSLCLQSLLEYYKL